MLLEYDYDNMDVYGAYGTITCLFDTGKVMMTQRGTDSFYVNTLLTNAETHMTSFSMVESEGMLVKANGLFYSSSSIVSGNIGPLMALPDAQMLVIANIKLT